MEYCPGNKQQNFTVQSSDDAQHWNTLGTVAAAGNSSQKADYSFTDINVMNSGKSIVYYRLISTDIDGESQKSEVIYLKINGAIIGMCNYFLIPCRII